MIIIIIIENVYTNVLYILKCILILHIYIRMWCALHD